MILPERNLKINYYRGCYSNFLATLFYNKDIKKYQHSICPLVMVHQEYSFWEGILHKSKTSKMAGRTRIPLLALPNPKVA